MSIVTIDKKNFATSIGKIYRSITKQPTAKFFVLPASSIPLDEDYDLREYLQDMIVRSQIEKDQYFMKLSLETMASPGYTIDDALSQLKL